MLCILQRIAQAAALFPFSPIDPPRFQEWNSTRKFCARLRFEKRSSFGKSPESEAVTCSLTPESRSFSLSILWTTTPPRQTSNNPRPPPNTAASRSPKTTASNREEVKPKSVTVTTCSSEYISSRAEIPSCGWVWVGVRQQDRMEDGIISAEVQIASRVINKITTKTTTRSATAVKQQQQLQSPIGFVVHSGNISGNDDQNLSRFFRTHGILVLYICDFQDFG